MNENFSSLIKWDMILVDTDALCIEVNQRERSKVVGDSKAFSTKVVNH